VSSGLAWADVQLDARCRIRKRREGFAVADFAAEDSGLERRIRPLTLGCSNHDLHEIVRLLGDVLNLCIVQYLLYLLLHPRPFLYRRSIELWMLIRRQQPRVQIVSQTDEDPDRAFGLCNAFRAYEPGACPIGIPDTKPGPFASAVRKTFASRVPLTAARCRALTGALALAGACPRAFAGTHADAGPSALACPQVIASPDSFAGTVSHAAKEPSTRSGPITAPFALTGALAIADSNGSIVGNGSDTRADDIAATHAYAGTPLPTCAKPFAAPRPLACA